LGIDVKFAGVHATLSDEDTADHIIKTIAETGRFYEEKLLAELYHRAMPDWFFVDVGAHIGNHSVFLGKILGLCGIALEPNPASFKKLCFNLSENGLDNQVGALKLAAGELSGRGNVKPPSKLNNSGMTRIVSSEDGPVVIQSLDSLQLGRLDLLKLDVEGSEVRCIKGARSTLLRHKPLLVIEASNTSNFLDIRALLAPIGYNPIRRFNSTPTYLFEHSSCAS